MLTVVIETRNDEEALARTLASLVGAAVEGIVRDVIVCDRGSTDQTHRVAELAGCSYVAEGGIAAALRQAKGEWILLLEPGARLSEGWSESVIGHVTRLTMPARFSRSRSDRRPFLSRILTSRTALSEGLVIRKGQAISLSGAARTAEALARGLASKRLEAEIRVAERRGAGRR
jgi:glycosyltransferase involved in cell wall biosynthesis